MQASAEEAGALFGASAEVGREILRAMGEVPEEDGPLALSTDCQEPVRLFDAVSSQWRVGFGGAYALDFLAVDKAATWLAITPSPSLLRDIAIMEAAGLKLMEERR